MDDDTVWMPRAAVEALKADLDAFGSRLHDHVLMGDAQPESTRMRSTFPRSELV